MPHGIYKISISVKVLVNAISVLINWLIISFVIIKGFYNIYHLQIYSALLVCFDKNTFGKTTHQHLPI